MREFLINFQTWERKSINYSKKKLIIELKTQTLGYSLLGLDCGDFGDFTSSILAFSSESKLPFSASDCWLRSSFKTLFVSSSASTIPLLCGSMWHSMVFWLIALFVNAGRLISHISARGSIFILETMISSSYRFNASVFLFNSVCDFTFTKLNKVSVDKTMNTLIFLSNYFNANKKFDNYRLLFVLLWNLFCQLDWLEFYFNW